MCLGVLLYVEDTYVLWLFDFLFFFYHLKKEEIETKHFKHTFTVLGTALQSHLLTKTGQGVVRFTTPLRGFFLCDECTFHFASFLNVLFALWKVYEISFFFLFPFQYISYRLLARSP